METVYIIRKSSGRIHGREAYRSLESATKVINELKEYYDNHFSNQYIDEVKLPFLKRSVCYLSLYKGFDYDYSGGGMYDLSYQSDIYACSQHLKTNKWWTDAQEAKDKSPEDYYIDDNQICSIEYGKKFIYGDCMSGNFNLLINRLKVRP